VAEVGRHGVARWRRRPVTVSVKWAIFWTGLFRSPLTTIPVQPHSKTDCMPGTACSDTRGSIHRSQDTERAQQHPGKTRTVSARGTQPTILTEDAMEVVFHIHL
jgi:hypothetical protein